MFYYLSIAHHVPAIVQSRLHAFSCDPPIPLYVLDKT